MGDMVTCVSWNIHRGRGGDGRVDPDRVMATLGREVWTPQVDVLCLQEADAEAHPHAGVLDPAEVAAITGLRHAQGAPHLRSTPDAHGFLGVITYLHPRWRIEDVRLLDLPGLHPRGAVIVDAISDRGSLRICNTHLSLAQPLRIAQMRTLGQYLKRVAPRPTLLGGDFNEWRPWGGLTFSSRVLMERFRGPVRPTFPVGRPLIALDRFLVNPPGQVTEIHVLDGPGIRASSDHRPIRAGITLP